MSRSEGLAITTICLVALLVALLAWHDDPASAQSAGLQYNGGPTKTIALQRTSPALNSVPKGTNGCGTTTKIDQRGVHRLQGKKCDAGAFEKKVLR